MSTRFTTFGRLKRLGYTMLGVCATIGLLCLLKGTPVQAQGPGVNLTALNNQVQAMQATITAQAGTIAILQTTVNTHSTEIANLQNTVNTHASSITSLQTSVAALSAQVNNLQTTVTSQATQISALQTTVGLEGAQITALAIQTQYISTGTDENGYPATFITGCNLWVQDGSGTTGDANLDAPTGLGNLIIGYNAKGGNILISNPNGDFRTGSHNLIVGDYNSYSGFGGLLAGVGNTLSNAAYASVSGGSFNTASGFVSSISGGQLITQATNGGWSAGTQDDYTFHGSFVSP